MWKRAFMTCQILLHDSPTFLAILIFLKWNTLNLFFYNPHINFALFMTLVPDIIDVVIPFVILHIFNLLLLKQVHHYASYPFLTDTIKSRIIKLDHMIEWRWLLAITVFLKVNQATRRPRVVYDVNLGSKR